MAKIYLKNHNSFLSDPEKPRRGRGGGKGVKMVNVRMKSYQG